MDLLNWTMVARDATKSSERDDQERLLDHPDYN